MNAVNALYRDQQEAKADAAIEAAKGWVETARPLILLYLRLDAEDSKLCCVPHQDEQPALYSAVADGRRIVETAREALYAEIESVRDQAVHAAAGAGPTHRDPVAEDEWLALVDVVEGGIPKVEAAIRQIEREAV